MISRNRTNKSIPINIAGSSVFGRYPKINIEKTYNMFISDGFLVPYTGYQKAITQIGTPTQSGKGRGLHVSNKLNKMLIVVGNGVYLVEIFFDQNALMTQDFTVFQVGTLNTSTGKVYITENNVPQFVISDSVNLYVYDPTNTTTFYKATKDGAASSTANITFTPGFVDFHDTYVLVAARNDTGASAGLTLNNTWRLSSINDITGQIYFPDDPANVGVIQTKPDNTQAVVRFPGKGNMIMAFGKTVGEPWMDVGYQLFPYQRSTSFSIDYGVVSPATIARNDEIVVWLARNENSGPVIMVSDGGMPQKITTDGIDYLFANMTAPEDSQGFLFRQDGHLFYHINFYTDNLSLFYDFNTKKFFHASDENLNYYIASVVGFLNNQYYFISNKNGNLYTMDTIFTTYDGLEIPRIRTCKNIRLPSQEYFSITDIGFTIEQGTTNPQQQSLGFPRLITQDGRQIITQDGRNLISNSIDYLVTYPRVDMSISIDGGNSFSSYIPYNTNPLAYTKNKIQWWQLGVANDFVPQFRFWGFGRFVATDGMVNIRQ